MLPDGDGFGEAVFLHVAEAHFEQIQVIGGVGSADAQVGAIVLTPDGDQVSPGDEGGAFGVEVVRRPRVDLPASGDEQLALAEGEGQRGCLHRMQDDGVAGVRFGGVCFHGVCFHGIGGGKRLGY